MPPNLRCKLNPPTFLHLLTFTSIQVQRHNTGILFHEDAGYQDSEQPHVEQVQDTTRGVLRDEEPEVESEINANVVDSESVRDDRETRVVQKTSSIQPCESTTCNREKTTESDR